MDIMIDISNKAIEEYNKAIAKKKEAGHECEVWPSGRFFMSHAKNSHTGGELIFNGLVCSDKMGDHNTGISAGSCNECAKRKKK